MTQATDVDIRELKDLIVGLDRKIDAGFAQIETKFAKLDGRIDTLETKMIGKFDTVNARITNLESNTKAVADLAEKVGEFKNWKQIAIVIFTTVVGGAIGWFVKGGKIS
jgi:uncharacterized protein YdcH (DUF465 family)